MTSKVNNSYFTIEVITYFYAANEGLSLEDVENLTAKNHLSKLLSKCSCVYCGYLVHGMTSSCYGACITPAVYFNSTDHYLITDSIMFFTYKGCF